MRRISRAAWTGFLSAALITGITTAISTAPLPAQEEAESAADRAEKLIAMIQALEEEAPSSGVLDGIELEKAPVELRRLARTLRETRLDLILEKRDLPSTVDILRQVTGVNFVISQKARAAIESTKPELTLTLRGLTVENVLNLLQVHLGDLRFTVRYGAVMLVAKEEAPPPKTLRIYDVTDLVRPHRDFPAPTLALKELKN